MLSVGGVLQHLAADDDGREELRSIRVLAEVVGKLLGVASVRDFLPLIVEADDELDMGLCLLLVRPDPAFLARKRRDETLPDDT